MESFIPGPVFTFLINGIFYTFQNYTLIHADSDAYLLSPTLAPVNAHYESLNYQFIDQFFPSSSFGFEGVNSLLQSISETNITKDKLGSLFQQSGESSASAQPSYVLDTTTSALRSVFLQMLSSITNPFVNGVISIIFFLSLLWAINLTVWTLRVIITHLFAIARNKLSAKNDDDDRNAIANQSSGRWFVFCCLPFFYWLFYVLFYLFRIRSFEQCSNFRCFGIIHIATTSTNLLFMLSVFVVLLKLCNVRLQIYFLRLANL